MPQATLEASPGTTLDQSWPVVSELVAMMRLLGRVHRVLIWDGPAARPTTVDAVTQGAALELVAQINKTGLQQPPAICNQYPRGVRHDADW